MRSICEGRVCRVSYKNCHVLIDRELDFDVFNILKVDLITKAALDTNMNTKVT